MNERDVYLNDEIDLKEIFDVLWAAKMLIIQITAFFAVASVTYSLLLTNYYKSESLLIARNASESQGLSQYSGLAAMAGINLPSSGEDRAAQTIELIKSRKFIKHLLEFEDVLPSIMAAKKYNHASGKLSFYKDIYDAKERSWIKKPTYLQAHKHFRKMLNISQDTATGFITIEIEHISPIFAKEFLELIINEANVLLRNKDMEESKQGLEYLTSELSKTSFVEIQESINALIEAQLEKQMMTQINEDYILIEIEPPFIPEEKSKPSRAIICILGTMLGGILSLMIVLVRHYYFSLDN
ncbi:MAG: LPS O-antigen length regulator [Flavobacteriales bacterium]|nr:LPS O-antigen length regulator [Flavobacteriales bacterium]